MLLGWESAEDFLEDLEKRAIVRLFDVIMMSILARDMMLPNC